MSYVPGNQDSWDTVAKQFDVMSPLLPFGNGSEITPCPRPKLNSFAKERMQYAVCDQPLNSHENLATVRFGNHSAKRVRITPAYYRLVLCS